MKILFILNSQSETGTPGKKTGYWPDEIAVPYDQMAVEGADSSLASVKGRLPSSDPGGELPEGLTETTMPYEIDQEFNNNILKLSTLKEIDYDEFFIRIVYFRIGLKIRIRSH